MKWLTAFSLTIAVLALTALALALKIGPAQPAKFEDLTILGDGLSATNINLFITISNQTHREIAVAAVLDGSVSFGASLIRDQHFGDTSLGMHAQPGDHTLAIMIAGRPSVTHTFTFRTTPATNIVLVEITGRPANYSFRITQTDKPLSIM